VLQAHKWCSHLKSQLPWEISQCRHHECEHAHACMERCGSIEGRMKAGRTRTPCFNNKQVGKLETGAAVRQSAHLCTTPTVASAAAASSASRFVTKSASSAAEQPWEAARGTARAAGRWRGASAHGRAEVKAVPRSTCCAGSAGDIMLRCSESPQPVLMQG